MNPTYNIDITQSAIEQIRLIQKNDFTIESQAFRLTIDGKGCTGFTYGLGFSKPKQDDLLLTFSYKDQSFVIVLDPFAAYYCKNGIIDYKRNIQTGEEGFLFINHDEKNHQGKFFKNEQKVPSHL